MRVYNVLTGLFPKLEIMEPLIGKSPNIISFSLKVGWLGVMEAPLTVEIKADTKLLGWIYGDPCLLYFRIGKHYYEVELKTLKELTESKLKEKNYSDEPKINCLSRSEDGRIVTLISVEDLLTISSKVVMEQE